MAFPSPARDYMEDRIDLNTYLIDHPASTYFFRVKGISMEPTILDGSLVVIDRAVKPRHGHIILAIVHGEFTIRRLVKTGNAVFLQPDNEDYKGVQVTDGIDFEVWGVVIGSVIKF